MTQTELSWKLDVSDKTISKWENGQAFPRIETFERLAQALGTTMEEILSASRDGVKRVCFFNSYCPVLQIEVNGALFALHHEECKWVAVESEEIILKVRGDGEPVLTPNVGEDAPAGKRVRNKATRFIERTMSELLLHAGCTYHLTGVAPERIITIEEDIFNVEDPTVTLPPFGVRYPRLKCEGIGVELLEAVPLNRRAFISGYHKLGLVFDLGMELLGVLLLFPVRAVYARHYCRRKVLTKRIRNADAIRERERRHNEKWGKWYIGAALLILLGIFVLVAIG